MANPPYQYITQTGVIIPDTSTILSDVETEYKDVFGADLVTTPDTPQGVLINAEALARVKVVNSNAALGNQINPNVAGGIFLDAIMALTGMQRTQQTQTVVSSVSLSGVPGTLIPASSQASTPAGDIFQSASDVTLDASGNGTANFIALNFGPVPCAANELTQITSGVLGWETVNNMSPGALGASTQSDQAARALRNNTLAFQGVSLAEAVTSALYATSGVSSLTFQENICPNTQVINGISMIGHSIYACIDGGLDNDVAATLLENKSSGCAWNGSTSVSVIEPASGQSYQVKFDRPTNVQILIRVTTTNGNAANIANSVLDYANGKINGLQGFVVGADVSPFEIAGAIMAENPSYYISKVEVCKNVVPVAYSTNSISIGVNEKASTLFNFISVISA